MVTPTKATLFAFCDCDACIQVVVDAISAAHVTVKSGAVGPRFFYLLDKVTLCCAILEETGLIAPLARADVTPCTEIDRYRFCGNLVRWRTLHTHTQKASRVAPLGYDGSTGG